MVPYCFVNVVCLCDLDHLPGATIDGKKRWIRQRFWKNRRLIENVHAS